MTDERMVEIGDEAGGAFLLDDRTVVALDLETTGLQPEQDEIIEIGAVRFRGPKVLATFHTLVNPFRPLPPFIALLTGITSEELQTAPPLGEVGGALLSFVGDTPILGQNVGFDLAFLKQKGLSLPGPVYDTLEIALILHPRLPEHGLAALARSLDLSHDNPHRALDDALTTMHVFRRLLARAGTLNRETLQALEPLVRGRDWPFGRLLLERAHSQVSGEEGSQALVRTVLARMESRAGTSLHPRLVQEPVDLDRVADLLGPHGPLASTLEDFEERPQQWAMAAEVTQALNAGQATLIEAAAGTGKSLAYLVPALAFAQANRTPVLISTSTRGLQEQLLTKELPTALLALGPQGEGLRIAMLKGQGNYLCLHRLATRLHTPNLSLEEARFLLRLLVWLEESVSGDRGELNLWPHEQKLWELVRASEGRSGAACPFHRQGTCFLSQARRQAQEAHLILTNHAFLLADVARDRGLLAHVHHLILDEAHHLEAEATSQFGDRLGLRDLADALGRLREEGQENLRLTQRACSAVAARSLAPARLATADSASQEVDAAAGRALDQARLLFNLLEQVVVAVAGEQSEYEQRVRLIPSTRHLPQWTQALRGWEDLDALLQETDDCLGHLLAAVEDTEDQGLETDLEVVRQSLSDLRSRLQALMMPAAPADVRWLSRRSARDVALERAPFQTGTLLRDRLFAHKQAIILTSATLSMDGEFDYMKAQVGLEEARDLLLESPFDYRTASAIFIPRDMPEPGTHSYGRAVEQALLELASATRGHALALFTSSAALRGADNFVKPALEARGVGVLAQGINGQPARLLEVFRRQPEALLLGTATFWEGVDLAGEALQLLVMVRLPFRVPTDPVFAARSEAFGDPFSQYALPESLLRFRQGFGRLIRTRQDQGAIVILDSRLLTKSYGQAFLDALPGSPIATPTLRDLPAEVARWLGDHPTKL